MKLNSAVKSIVRVHLIQIRQIISIEGKLFFFLGLVGITLLLLLLFHPLAGLANVMMISTIHFTRKDKRFLNIIYPKEFSQILTIEYLTVSLPFIVINFFNNYGLFVNIAVILLILLYSYVLKNQSIQSFSRILLNLNFFVPAINYEWKSGLRKNGSVIILIYLLSMVILYKLRLEYFYFFALIFLYAIIAGFYEENEPPIFMNNRGKNPKLFLTTTILLHYKSFIQLLSPIIILQLVLFHGFMDILILLWNLIFGMIFLIFLNINKYLYYGRGVAIITWGNKIVLGIVLFSSLFPLLIGIPIFFVIQNYNKTLTNLKLYF